MATYRKPHRVGLKADGLRGVGRNTPLEFITPRYEAGLKAAEIPTGVVGVAAEGLMADIVTANLTSNLEICIDIAAASCYDNSVDSQTLFDMSGNENDFHFGAGAGSSTDDPTITGTAGALDDSVYATFDGGDAFTLKAENTSFTNALHHDGADFTVLQMWYWSNNAAVSGLFGNSSNDGAGFYMVWESNEKYQLNCKRDDAGTAFYTQSTGGEFSTLPGWKATVLSYNENGGSTASFARRTDADESEGYIGMNGADTWNGNYTSPSSGVAEHPFQIGSGGDLRYPAVANNRFAMLAMWSESLTTGQIDPLLQSASISTRYSL